MDKLMLDNQQKLRSLALCGHSVPSAGHANCKDPLERERVCVREKGRESI